MSRSPRVRDSGLPRSHGGATAELCAKGLSTVKLETEGFLKVFGSRPASGLLWLPDALGQDGLRLKWGKGRFWSKNDKKIRVLRMGFAVVVAVVVVEPRRFGRGNWCLHFPKALVRN